MERHHRCRPDVKLTFTNAGHILGSSVHLHVGEGKHNIVFSGFGTRSRVVRAFDSRCETFVIESTYGAASDFNRVEEASQEIQDVISRTLRRNGKVSALSSR